MSPHHGGHRNRMRQKLLNYSADAFHPHELIEMLLYPMIPARDTNPIAHRLLDRFGSIEGVLAASAEDLCRVEGIGKRSAERFHAMASATLQLIPFAACSCTMTGERFDSYEKTGEYFVRLFEGITEPKILMLMLNASREPIGLVEIGNFDFSSGAVVPENFLREALRARACIVYLAHNHPFGTSVPSAGDYASEALIASAFEKVDITVADHFVVAGKRFFGMVSDRRKILRQNERPDSSESIADTEVKDNV